jgi:hypothetical protein
MMAGLDVVPMPGDFRVGGNGGRGYPFALCSQKTLDVQKPWTACVETPSGLSFALDPILTKVNQNRPVLRLITNSPPPSDWLREVPGTTTVANSGVNEMNVLGSISSKGTASPANFFADCAASFAACAASSAARRAASRASVAASLPPVGLSVPKILSELLPIKSRRFAAGSTTIVKCSLPVISVTKQLRTVASARASIDVPRRQIAKIARFNRRTFLPRSLPSDHLL